MNNENRPYCPMSFNVSPDVASDGTYDCVKERCAWWCEEAQKCALLVLAESQRKVVRNE